MRHSASEKMEIIRLVEGSSLAVKRTLQELDVGSQQRFISGIERTGERLRRAGHRTSGPRRI